jgi:hypothetical protein
MRPRRCLGSAGAIRVATIGTYGTYSEEILRLAFSNEIRRYVQICHSDYAIRNQCIRNLVLHGDYLLSMVKVKRTIHVILI